MIMRLFFQPITDILKVIRVQIIFRVLLITTNSTTGLTEGLQIATQISVPTTSVDIPIVSAYHGYHW